jgi:hypothetical protein
MIPFQRVLRLFGNEFVYPFSGQKHLSTVLGPGMRHFTEGYNIPREELRSQGLYPTTETDAGLILAECMKDDIVYPFLVKKIF